MYRHHNLNYGTVPYVVLLTVLYLVHREIKYKQIRIFEIGFYQRSTNFYIGKIFFYVATMKDHPQNIDNYRRTNTNICNGKNKNVCVCCVCVMSAASPSALRACVRACVRACAYACACTCAPSHLRMHWSLGPYTTRRTVAIAWQFRSSTQHCLSAVDRVSCRLRPLPLLAGN